MLRLIERFMPKIVKDGSVVLSLGEPTLSLYQERVLIKFEDELGLKLCQRFAWNSPSKLPAPAEWVTVPRVRVKPSLGCVF